MTWQLTPDEIAKYWKVIQYGAVLSSGTTKVKEYSLGLLRNLLIGQYQCWFILNVDKKIKMTVITRITKDEGGIGHLIIDPIFGFLATDEAEQMELLDIMKKFAKKLNLESISGHIANPRAAFIAKRLGMNKTQEIYELKIGEK